MEIERRFLIESVATIQNITETARHITIEQGYFFAKDSRSVRVRTCNTQGFLTAKKRIDSLSSLEFEYEIPFSDAQILLDTMVEGYRICKERYYVPASTLVWEIDIFALENYGLIIAEIELPTQNTTFIIPEWVGREITDDTKYSNASLSQIPYCLW